MTDLATLFEESVLSLTRNGPVRGVIERSPGAKEVLHRFIAGSTAFQALSASRDLQATGRSVSVAYLGRDGETPDEALTELTGLLEVAHATGRTAHGMLDVSVRPSTLGDVTAAPGTPAHADLVERAQRLLRAATNAGVSVTLDAEGPETIDAAHALAAELRQDHPDVAITVQAYLRRSEQDCRDLAAKGARVRLCKGAYATDGQGVGSRHEIDKAFVRCLSTLLAGPGYVMVATHDERLVAITSALAAAHGRRDEDYEVQMYLGVRPLGQTAIADRGLRCRVYVPYGPAWYTYLTARVAERPSTTIGLARSVLTRR